jgi:hypothetical protein
LVAPRYKAGSGKTANYLKNIKTALFAGMKTSIFISRQIVYYLMTLCLLLLACPAMAQIEDTSKVIIHVDNMQTMTGIKTDTG